MRASAACFLLLLASCGEGRSACSNNRRSLTNSEKYRLSSDSFNTRMRVLKEISWRRIKSDEAVETLKKLIPAEAKTQRERMVEMPDVELVRILDAFELVEDEEALIEACRVGLSWKAYDIREHAARALGSMGPGGAPCIPDLMQLLERERRVANTAAHALGDIGPAARDAVPLLVELLRNRDTQREGDALISRHNEWDASFGKVANPGIGASYGLRKIGVSNEQVLAALREASTDENDFVRQEAQRALRALE